MRSAIVTTIIAAFIAIVFMLGSNEGVRPFITLGVSNGTIFGLVALGLVLVYKGTRVFNFAQGEFGTIAAYILFFLSSNQYLGLPRWIGVLAAIFVALVVGLLAERLFIRPLINAPRITVLVVTIAIGLLFIGLQILFARIEPRSLDPLIPSIGATGETTGLAIGGFTLEPQRLISLGLLAALGGGLAYFFSRTDLGLAVLATSQDSYATKVVGIGVERMSRFIWGSAAVLGAIAGILYIPLVGALTPGVMTTNILIPAFTAAVLGGMTSLPGAFVGGIVIGFVQATAQYFGGRLSIGDRVFQEIVPGAEQLVIFLVLLIVLLARPQGLLGREA